MRTYLLSLVALVAWSGRGTAARLPQFPHEQLPVAIQNVHSGKCLDIRAAGGDGAILQQYTCGDQENQTFHLLWVGGDRYQLRPGHYGNVRLVVFGSEPARLANRELREQQFRFTAHPDGTFSIVNHVSDQCLDVPNWSLDDGMQIQQWSCTNGTNQRWRIVPRARPLHLVAKHSNRCVDVVGASYQWGAPLQQYDCLGSQQDNQDWIPEPLDGGFRFRSQHSNLCLTTNGFSTGLIQWPCDAPEFQRFTVAVDPDGYSELRSTVMGLCVQAATGSSANGIPINLGACTGENHQRFRFQRHVRRRLLVMQPATSAGGNRHVAPPGQFEQEVDLVNAIYQHHGIEVLFDPATDVVNVDSDAVHALNDEDYNDDIMHCRTLGGWWWQLYTTPPECARQFATMYPDRIVVILGSGSWAGLAGGHEAFMFIRPGLHDSCGTGIATGHLPHELGHHFGLGHTFWGSGYTPAEASAAFVANPAGFDHDFLDETLPDPFIRGSSCLAIDEPFGLQSFSVPNGWAVFPVSTANIMSAYWNFDPEITPQQAAIVRATATIRGL
jgi:hypothetical protein